MEQNRSNFTSKIGFVLAAAGSAVGLGNLWRFPYLAAKYGGGAFLLVYMILAVTFGFSLMIAEIAIGRKTKLSAIGAFEKLDKRFSFVGVLGSLVPMIILPYYSVIGGWVTKYCFAYITEGAKTVAQTVNTGGAELTYFENFVSKPVEPLIWFGIFIGITLIVVIGGVEKGVETASKWMMPILVILSIGLSIKVLTMDGAMEGLIYYIKPDFRNITPMAVLAAMGQLFYSLSLAMGIMITYGSYMKKDVSIESSTKQIEIFDCGIAFLAGLMIIPAIFATGQQANMKAGPSLMFIILPDVFEKIKGGTFIGIAFFFLVFCAAITSSISLTETVSSILQDKFKMSRNKSVFWVLIICLLFGIPSSLGNGPWANIKILGFAFLDFFDFISNSVMMPIVALFTCILVGYVIKPKAIVDEVKLTGGFKREKLFVVTIKYIAPILMVLILVSSVLSGMGIITM